MSDFAWIGIAQMPAIWVVVCEVFFFVFLLRDQGLTLSPKLAIQHIWPFARILFFAMFGALVGMLFFGFFGPVARWIGFFLGTLPAVYMVDQLLCKMRPETRLWRWVATPVALLQGGVSAWALA